MVLAGALLAVALGGTPWGELRESNARVRRGEPPTANQRWQALEEMQRVLARWQRERREFTRDAEQRARDQLPRDASQEGTVEAAHFGKVIEVGKGNGSPGRFGKVIELRPDSAPAPQTLVDEELASAEERAETTRRKKREDPEAFALQRARRERLAAGNRAFEEAIGKRFRERQAQIEAEARRMQAELDTARRREELLQAKKLGGTLDAEGNFVDSELDKEPN